MRLISNGHLVYTLASHQNGKRWDTIAIDRRSLVPFFTVRPCTLVIFRVMICILDDLISASSDTAAWRLGWIFALTWVKRWVGQRPGWTSSPPLQGTIVPARIYLLALRMPSWFFHMYKCVKEGMVGTP
mmetsp:Transcript_6240/g.12267  ORF Transcript_6240/g.12267 Transcript_6240/m.12267 type:complete len:129 (+) Transcript_6240:64-450(+)